MPSTIALETHVVDVFGIDSPFWHLYLVKTVTDDSGNVVSEKVIRGGPGPNFELSVQANVELGLSEDFRGSDTPQERRHTELDLGGRDADAVWNLMVQHALKIQATGLPYGYDIFQQEFGPDVNSNTVVASSLHTVGIEVAGTLPRGLTPGDVPLYDTVRSVVVNDHLNGGRGQDLIKSGSGDDFVHSGNGNDRLFGEDGNDRLMGAGGDDRLSGGIGNDELRGGVGNDVLTGSSGFDAFVFNIAPNAASNVDTLRDFSSADDALWLTKSAFSALTGEGRLKGGQFWKGAEAHDANDHVIYTRSTGALYYDPDGNGAAEQVQFAQLKAGTALTTFDIFVI
jgi:hypothetical protein